MGACFTSYLPILKANTFEGDILMKNYDYIRFMTEEMMKLIAGHPNRKDKEYKDWKQEWFGIIPASIKLFWFH